jgi:hypothetical protein
MRHGGRLVVFGLGEWTFEIEQPSKVMVGRNAFHRRQTVMFPRTHDYALHVSTHGLDMDLLATSNAPSCMRGTKIMTQGAAYSTTHLHDTSPWETFLAGGIFPGLRQYPDPSASTSTSIAFYGVISKTTSWGACDSISGPLRDTASSLLPMGGLLAHNPPMTPTLPQRKRSTSTTPPK